jgi:nucleoside-diphosphate-sugar epimerase
MFQEKDKIWWSVDVGPGGRMPSLEQVQEQRDAVQVKKQYGWEPKVALREGLGLMVDDFKERLSITSPNEEALEDNVLAK